MIIAAILTGMGTMIIRFPGLALISLWAMIFLVIGLLSGCAGPQGR